ncbi:hypothetical protein [Enterobacter cloacae complex sp. 285F6]|uniref:hypothetical protein n=1 Tax=Enterobacter cloacae complex sp. 285F6 TaxID=3395831 RepID=UPI003CEDEAED
MKKVGIVCLTLIMAALVGCSSQSSQEEPEMAAARQCSDQVIVTSKNKTGTTKLTSILKDEATIVRVGDSSQETHQLKVSLMLSLPHLIMINPGQHGAVA